MPRDSSGNYTLPAGNPVVTGSTISSSWANTTLTDIGGEITDSLDRSGKGAMLSVLKVVDGSVSSPGFAFGSEPGTGLYRPTASQVAITVTGNQVVLVSTTLVNIAQPVTITVADNQAINFRGANSARGYNLVFNDTTASAARGFIGIGISTVTGMVVTDFGIAAGSGGSVVIGTANGGAIATRFGPNGNVTISTPSSGTAFLASGASNNYVAQLLGSATSGQSYGINIIAGTTSADFGLQVVNQAGTFTQFRVRGDGVVFGNDGTSLFELGYKDTPLNTQSTNYTPVVSDRGKTIQTGSTVNYTINTNVFQAGAVLTFRVANPAVLTIVQGSGFTLQWAGNGAATGNRTLTGEGLATLLYTSTTSATISGAGLS